MLPLTPTVSLFEVASPFNVIYLMGEDDTEGGVRKLSGCVYLSFCHKKKKKKEKEGERSKPNFAGSFLKKKKKKLVGVLSPVKKQNEQR